jgi:ectoine hydroxylase-related dioxygenase (phytanoyl-CoA dioxygenase family)
MGDAVLALGKALKTFDQEIRDNGWSVFPGLLPPDQTKAMRADALKWVARCRDYQMAAGINRDGDGTAHHSVGDNDSLDAFLHQHLLHPYISHYFGDQPYIMHACNPVGGFPATTNYVHSIHRDSRTCIQGYRLRINMLVMIDAFTIENGATQVLPGSQTMAKRPSDEVFARGCRSLTGPAGTVVLFDSYLWHRGTANTTPNPRVAHTLAFGPAFIKPQMDYARMLGESRGKNFSTLSRQVLGYNSRVPISLQEWYRPRETRLYKADQG